MKVKEKNSVRSRANVFIVMLALCLNAFSDIHVSNEKSVRMFDDFRSGRMRGAKKTTESFAV